MAWQDLERSFENFCLTADLPVLKAELIGHAGAHLVTKKIEP
jgi:hypothetical protein